MKNSIELLTGIIIATVLMQKIICSSACGRPCSKDFCEEAVAGGALSWEIHCAGGNGASKFKCDSCGSSNCGQVLKAERIKTKIFQKFRMNFPGCPFEDFKVKCDSDYYSLEQKKIKERLESHIFRKFSIYFPNGNYDSSPTYQCVAN
mmetsp:Transcript_11374/g.22528  ORF Transcript_11374/g.22528 Transcript_11374/m.22528 type:complete len:148 (+) Transcript_11374:64-507(+)